MDAVQNITIPHDEIAAFCKRHHIRKLSLFGSVLRDDFGPKSDIDVLIEYEPDYTEGFIAFAGTQTELSQILGREVDLNTSEDLSRYFREKVLATAVVQYEQR